MLLSTLGNYNGQRLIFLSTWQVNQQRKSTRILLELIREKPFFQFTHAPTKIFRVQCLKAKTWQTWKAEY